MKKLLITGALKKNDAFFDELASSGYDIIYHQSEREELSSEAYEAEAIICNGLFLYHDIEKFKNLQLIQLTSAGLDRVPLDYINEHGIKIYNARGVYSVPMAEFAIFGVLTLYKAGTFFYENQKDCVWNKHRGLIEIYGKRVLVVGAGSVGTECAKRFNAFGAHTVGVDLYPRDDENYEYIAPLSALEKELSLADIVVLTLPLTEQTSGLFDKAKLSLMKKTAILINIARGAVIDTAALISVLQSGDIGGAVLDVFEEEPLSPESPFWSLKNLIITPHNSFVSDGNEQRIYSVIRNNLKGY